MFSMFKKNSQNQIAVSEIEALLGKIDLIDIREVNEYKTGHVPKAKNIPMNTLLGQPDKYLKKESVYHIICQSGGRSRGAAQHLTRLGFQIVDVLGGTGKYPGKLDR